jgi:hypothetical protein
VFQVIWKRCDFNLVETSSHEVGYFTNSVFIIWYFTSSELLCIIYIYMKWQFVERGRHTFLRAKTNFNNNLILFLLLQINQPFTGPNPPANIEVIEPTDKCCISLVESIRVWSAVHYWRWCFNRINIIYTY